MDSDLLEVCVTEAGSVTPESQVKCYYLACRLALTTIALTMTPPQFTGGFHQRDLQAVQ